MIRIGDWRTGRVCLLPVFRCVLFVNLYGVRFYVLFYFERLEQIADDRNDFIIDV